MNNSDEWTTEQALEYLINYVPTYDEISIVSYTPALLLKPDRKDELKANYVAALKKRCSDNKLKTTLYVAESGLKEIRKGKRDEIKTHLEEWEEIVEIGKKNKKNFKIIVVTDKDLPSVSLVLAKIDVAANNKILLWDLLFEFHSGVEHQQLFSLGKGAKDDIWYPHLHLHNTPNVVDQILKSLTGVKFEEWKKQAIDWSSFPDPQLAIISAMPEERSKFRLKLPIKDEAEDSDENRHGRIEVPVKGKKISYEVIMPPVSYGNID
ncbi:MAG: hypothetical protein WBF38_06320, partial [Nitrosotalea sp.]